MLEFYHVDRAKGRLKEGQTINLTWDKSTISYRNNRADTYVSMFPDGVTQHGFDYLLNDKRPSPISDSNGMIEMLAEYIRRSYYPKRPSRFQSFFAWKTIQDAESFINRYPIMAPEGELRQGDIWLVQCATVAFEGDMTCLKLGDSWMDAITCLHLYWVGDGGQVQTPLWEVLLKPPVTIVKKIKTF